jgi:hypothetical protein
MTSLDHIVSSGEAPGVESEREIREPTETVAKLKGKEPMTRVMKKGKSGIPRTPEMICRQRLAKSAMSPFQGKRLQRTFKTEYGRRGKKRASRRCVKRSSDAA